MNSGHGDIMDSVKFYMELEKECGMWDLFYGKGGIGKFSEALSDLESLKRKIADCRSCGLYARRKNLVFGAGNPKANLMFIGEAPGEEEDLQGMPFVGRAGQLLTKIIEAMGLSRQEVYIANILKCRPPNNRAPLPEEIDACSENVRQQVEIIRPKVICTLGKFASQTFLKTDTPISALRGKFREYNGIKVMPTFHPAYLLRNPADKRLVWEDMKKIKKEMP
jgi:DNA polymerase